LLTDWGWLMFVPLSHWFDWLILLVLSLAILTVLFGFVLLRFLGIDGASWFSSLRILSPAPTFTSFLRKSSEVTEWMPLHLPTHSSLFLFRLFYFSSDAASNQPLTIVLAFTALSYLSYDHGHAWHEYPYPPFLFCWFVCLLAF